MAWWDAGPLLPPLTVYEQEKPTPAVVYDHTGQAWIRPRPPMGFIDPNNLPVNQKPRKDK